MTIPRFIPQHYRRQLQRLIREWSQVEARYPDSFKAAMADAIPAITPMDAIVMYSGLRDLAREYGCSVPVAELALYELLWGVRRL